jgi:hypothetical protein
MNVIERTERLSEIARARLPDYLVNGEPSIDASSPNPGAVEGYKVNTRFTKEGEPVTTREIKLHSPVQAIAELNKMEGEYAPQRTEITGKDGAEIKSFIFIMPDGTKKTPGELINGNSNAK